MKPTPVVVPRRGFGPSRPGLLRDFIPEPGQVGQRIGEHGQDEVPEATLHPHGPCPPGTGTTRAGYACNSGACARIGSKSGRGVGRIGPDHRNVRVSRRAAFRGDIARTCPRLATNGSRDVAVRFMEPGSRFAMVGLSDRRSSKRHPVVENVTRMRWREGREIRESPAQLMDITQGGALLIAYSPPPLFQVVEFRLERAHGDRMGRRLRRPEGPPRTGRRGAPSPDPALFLRDRHLGQARPGVLSDGPPPDLRPVPRASGTRGGPGRLNGGIDPPRLVAPPRNGTRRGADRADQSGSDPHPIRVPFSCGPVSRRAFFGRGWCFQRRCSQRYWPGSRRMIDSRAEV